MTPDDSNSRWFVVYQNQRFGPYPAEVLSEWIALKRIHPQSMVSNGGPWISTKEFLRQQSEQFVAGTQDVGLDMIDGTLPPLPRTAVPEIPPGSVATIAAPAVPEPQPSPAEVQQATGVQAGSKADEIQDDSPPDRDRIVVIGRRQSGKTIYLASVYAKLWQSLNGFNAKALSGDVHKQLMDAYHALRQGNWPAATLGTSHMEMELEYGGEKRLLVTLDYAGELFRKAFVEEDSEFPGVNELVNHIDRAVAVVLLVDPSVVAGMDHDAAMDDDFGLVQAVQRIRNWPDGASVPVVLVLTKMDQNQGLIDRFGSAKEFIRQHFPALVRLLKQIPIFQVSAVQIEKGPDGRPRPRPDSQPINIDTPLRYCLREIEKASEQVIREEQERQRRAMEMRLEQEEIAKEKRTNRMVLITVILIFVLGIAAAALIVIYKS